MWCNVRYLSNEYGNSENAERYQVAVDKWADSIRLTITFDEPVPGWGSGKIREVYFALPPRVAAAVSHALQLAGTGCSDEAVCFEVSEDATSARNGAA